MAVKLQRSQFLTPSLVWLALVSGAAGSGPMAMAGPLPAREVADSPAAKREAPPGSVRVASQETDPMSAADLAGTGWRLVAFGRDQPAPAEVEITAVFEADRLSGSAGCNRYFAGLEAGSGGNFALSAIGATRMACPAPLMEAEARYLSRLQRVRRARVEAGKLSLAYPDGEGWDALLFRPEP